MATVFVPILAAACATPRPEPAIAPRLAGIYDFRHPYRSAGEGALPAYVHDGEWGMRDGRPIVRRGQAYPFGSKRPLVLVYHGEPDFTLAFPAIAPEDVAVPVAGRIADLRRRELVILGVQLDFDLGAKGLIAYPRLLDALRERLPSGMHLSVTALRAHAADPSWNAIARRTDAICPMLYGYEGLERRWDAATSRAFLAAMATHRDKLVPVIARSRARSVADAEDLLREERIDSYLLFDLEPPS